MNTNKLGFPTTECERCGGTGQHSYNERNGRTCFGCNGKGQMITREAKNAWTQFKQAVEAARRPTVDNIAIGDIIVIQTNGWREVADIDTADACAWNSDNKPLAWQVAITFTDGTTAEVTTNTVCKRQAAVDPAPFLATI